MERPGVPFELAGLYWDLPSGDAGSVGTTAYQRIPEDEEMLDVADGFVASSIWLGDGRSPSKIIVRRFGEDGALRTIDTDTNVREGAIASGYLFWTGIQAAKDQTEPPRDGGIWAVDLADVNSTPIAIVAPGEDLSRFVGGLTVERLPFLVSLSERTLASTVGGGGGYRTDIIDTAELSLRAQLQGDTAIGVSDSVAIVRRGEPVTDGPVTIAAVDIESQATNWRLPSSADDTAIKTLGYPAVLSSSIAMSLHVVRNDLDQRVVVLIDIATGTSQDLIVHGPGDERLFVLPSLSSDSRIALSTATFEDAMGDDGRVSVSLLDLDTGELQVDAFRIDLP
jgi:hypothetical protein